MTAYEALTSDLEILFDSFVCFLNSVLPLTIMSMTEGWFQLSKKRAEVLCSL
jgi:hypothetical protein